jgi:hypothetical protein
VVGLDLLAGTVNNERDLGVGLRIESRWSGRPDSVGSLTGEAMLPAQRVGADARHQSPVDEPAHRGGAVAVEHQRPRRTRIVDARERIHLRDRQPLSNGVLGSSRGAFDPKTGSNLQEASQEIPKSLEEPAYGPEG